LAKKMTREGPYEKKRKELRGKKKILAGNDA